MHSLENTRASLSPAEIPQCLCPREFGGNPEPTPSFTRLLGLSQIFLVFRQPPLVSAICLLYGSLGHCFPASVTCAPPCIPNWPWKSATSTHVFSSSLPPPACPAFQLSGPFFVVPHPPLCACVRVCVAAALRVWGKGSALTYTLRPSVLFSAHLTA